MGQCSIVMGTKEGGNSMWHQRLPWVTHGLVAVMVIAGSLALLSCDSDDNGSDNLPPVKSTTLNSADVRTNVNSTNIALLAQQSTVIDAAAFGFDIFTGGGPGSSVLTITNVRPVTFNPNVAAGAASVPNGPASTSPQVNPPFTTTPVTTPAGQPPLANVACPAALGTAGTSTNPLGLAVAANPTTVADYSVSRIDGATFSGTLCIGAGTGAVSGPAQGGNVCVFTNFANSLQPGAQSVFSSCRLVVGTPTGVVVQFGNPIPSDGTLQLTVTNQRSNVAYTSQAIDVEVVLTADGSVVVDGVDTTINVAIPTLP